MKKNDILKMFVLFLFFIVFSSPVLSFGPHTHDEIGQELFKEQGSDIIRQCTLYKEDFMAGSVMPDISVIFYYEEEGKNYKVMHNWDMVNKLSVEANTQGKKCFVYGYAEHLVADSISHNYMVPELIDKYGMQNWMIHPLSEKKFDTIMVQEHPELLNSTPHILDIMFTPEGMFTPKGEEYIKMIERALGDNVLMDLRSETKKLSYALGAFYEDAYKPRGETAIFKAYPYVDKFTNFLSPVLGMSNAGKADQYFRKAKQLTLNTYNNWGARLNISPHGGGINGALTIADANVKNWNWILLLGLAIVPLGLTFGYTRINKFKKLSQMWWWLIFLGVFVISTFLTIFTAVMIVYAQL